MTSSTNADKYHGQGGTFQVKNGERVRVADAPKPHPEGDRARDEHGKPFDEKQEATAPALPKPGTPPWLESEKRPADVEPPKPVKKGS
jgi:hypothetical protein